MTNDGQIGAKGWGVKAQQRIMKGTFVSQYTGEVISRAEGERRRSEGGDTSYFFGLDFFTNESEGGEFFIVDAKRAGNVSRFFNHSCDPNLAVYAVHTDNADPLQHGLALFALKDIAKGEELTFSYSGSGANREMEGGGAKRCLCGSRQCIGILPS
ncbi:hypothetical protein HDU86_000750 [Geranomyces michiganensis]|nr:hypothetical protein HDU86_000750 [Geranomyces michiganensis]